MKSLERVKTALCGDIPDRVPVITFTNIASGNLGEDLTRYILEHADAQFEFPIKVFLYNEFPGVGIDVTRTDTTSEDGWITRTYSSPYGKSFSDQIRFSAGGMYRSYKKHIFHDIGEVEAFLAIPYVKPEDNPSFIAEIKAFCRIQDQHNTDHEFCMILINDALSFLAANADPQDMSLWTILERETIKRYFAEITKRMVEYIDHMLSNFDMECIFMLGGPEFGIPPLMSPADFEEFVFQYDRQLIETLHRYDKKVLVHSHGKINAFLLRFIEMGADGIHPLEAVGPTGDCDILAVKEKYGKEICLVGNIQYDDFQYCSEEGMDEIVKDLMAAAKTGGGFILSPACPMFHDKTTEGQINRNIRAFIDAGIRYGDYENS